MKLNYISTPTDLGGTAVPGCGTIYHTEIRPTLTKLSDDLEMPFDFNDYVLGSTGKREYSGDIDLVVDAKWWGQGVTAFRQNLEEVFGKENVARNANMLHLKYPIVQYDSEQKAAQPRTGFVQIDFNFGNSEWEKFYHYVDGKSAYKGAHRNLMLAAICSAVNTIESNEVDTNNRPVTQIRYKFGGNGLIKVRRTSKRDPRSGQWMKKQDDEIMDGPFTDPEKVARILLPCVRTVADLFSLETIMAAVKRNYGMTDCERIWKRAAHNFYDWKDGRNFYYPEEIAKYFPTDDK